MKNIFGAFPSCGIIHFSMQSMSSSLLSKTFSNHPKIGFPLWDPCLASLSGAGGGGGGAPEIPEGWGGRGADPPGVGEGGGGPAPPTERGSSPRPEFASSFKKSLASSEKSKPAMWSFGLVNVDNFSSLSSKILEAATLLATLEHCTSSWWGGWGWWRWYDATFNWQELPIQVFPQ